MLEIADSEVSGCQKTVHENDKMKTQNIVNQAPRVGRIENVRRTNHEQRSPHEGVPLTLRVQTHTEKSKRFIF